MLSTKKRFTSRTALKYPQKIVWVYPQKWVSSKKYPQMSEKGLGLPISEIKPFKIELNWTETKQIQSNDE